MNPSLYLDRDTRIHRLDPITKILSLVIGFAMCLCFNHPLYLAPMGVIVVLVALSARVLSNFWKLRYILLLLVLFSTLLWPFFVRGPTLLWAWGPLALSKESLLYGIAMGFRLATFVTMGLLFLSTTRNEELTGGLILLGLPYPVAFALSTALRLVPTFAGAGATIVQAQISRGLDLESGNVFHRAGKFIPLAVPLFIYAIRHTNLLAMALESKGYNPRSRRTFYYESHMRRIDFALLFLLTGILATFLYLRLALQLGVVLPGRV